MSNKTPKHVADAATAKGVLKQRSRLTLIGIMGSTKSPRALLMTTTGRTIRVSVGDNTPGGRVAAIGENKIILKGGGGTTTLEIPG
jgi:Tfp pilus assembly protein PilP